MKLLLLGGPRFLGFHLIEAALEAGHEVTLFNRGKSNPDLFAGVEKLKGDRDGNLDALIGRAWDAVIDTSGYIPRHVRASAELLADRVEHYTFVSSISVYADPKQVEEDSHVSKLEDEFVEEITGETYGALKALCEKAVEEVLPGRALNIRPGLIVGPRDPTDRFTYWPVRIAEGGEVLAPGDPQIPTQLIDVRDLAQWMIRMAESQKTGTYNAAGPDFKLTISDVLYTCKAVTGSDARFTWVSEDFLLEQEVQPFTEIPLWVPEEQQGMLDVNIDRALTDGLSFRPLKNTVQDTRTWYLAERDGDSLKAGITAKKEADLLAKWLVTNA